MNEVLELTKEALYLVMLLSGPPIGAAALVGLVIAFLQAATQLQEQTKLSAPVASPVGIGNGLNIALSVAGALTTTLFARSTVMVKHFAVS